MSSETGSSEVYNEAHFDLLSSFKTCFEPLLINTHALALFCLTLTVQSIAVGLLSAQNLSAWRKSLSDRGLD